MNGDGYRLVAITKEQRDYYAVAEAPAWGTTAWNAELVAAWDAAPADPVEAIADTLATLDGYPTNWRDEADIPDALRRDALAVLGALGATRETHT